MIESTFQGPGTDFLWILPLPAVPVVEPEDLANVFSGEPVRLEDSPGNYSLGRSDEGFKLRWHDADGAIVRWAEPLVLRWPAPTIQQP